MSKELNVLLQRILPPELQKPTEQKPSRDMMVLFERVERRRWKKVTEADMLLQLEMLHNEFAFIKHARHCERCLIELQLDIERYCGSHSPWYLNLINEDCDPDIYEDEESIYYTCPRPQDYKIGSYWTGASDDTIRFIKDRLTWAEGIMKGEIEAAVDFVAALLDWDLESPLPPYDSLLIFWGG